MEKKTCPYCGFLAHLVTKSGGIATYCCDRCNKLFKVSTDYKMRVRIFSVLAFSHEKDRRGLIRAGQLISKARCHCEPVRTPVRQSVSLRRKSGYPRSFCSLGMTRL